MRRLTITCRIAGGSGDTWQETYDEGASFGGFPLGHKDPAQWGADIVAHFNATLRPHEQAREFLGAEIAEISQGFEHVWEKTNAITIVKQRAVFDTFRCRVCGVTGRRYGVGTPVIDRKFRRKIFKFCGEETRAARVAQGTRDQR